MRTNLVPERSSAAQQLLSPTPRQAGRSRVILGLLIVLGLLAAAQLTWSLVVAAMPNEAAYGESIIHDQAGRLLRGEPLYQDYTHAPYTVTAYMPLYYVLAAALQFLVGPSFTAGRALSLAAGVLASAIVGRLTAVQAGSRRAGLLAALLFFAIGLGGGSAQLGSLAFQNAQLLHGGPPEDPNPAWSALYKEDLLGIALSLAAIGLLAERRSRGAVIAAAALAGLALLTKQTFVAASLAGVVWLAQSDRRAALAFLLVDLLVVGIPSAALQLTSGGAFLQNVLLANANPTSFAALSFNLKALVLFQGGLFVAAAWYLRSAGVFAQRGGRLGLLGVYWLASALPLLGLIKIGSNYNYWIEWAAPTACLATLAIWRAVHALPTRRLAWSSGALPTLAVGANVVILTALLCGPLLAASVRHATDSATSAQFQTVIDRVRSEPGEVLAAPLDVITLAGRRVLFEPNIFSLWYSSGQWDPTPMVQRICSGDVTLLVLDRPVEAPPTQFQGAPSWPQPVLDALRQRAVLDTYLGGRFIYRLTRPCTASS